MSVLSLDLGENQLRIDLGEIDEHGTGGELIYSGNIYLHIDGREYGSLFITRGPDGAPQIALGQYQEAAEQWVQVNPIQAIPLPLAA